MVAHADAIILDGEGAFVGIDGERDARLGVIAEESRVGNGVVTQLLVGVGRVRDQLAQKHRFIRIDRVHHQVEELGDIGLKCSAFGAGLLRSGHGWWFPGMFSTVHQMPRTPREFKIFEPNPPVTPALPAGQIDWAQRLEGDTPIWPR